MLTLEYGTCIALPSPLPQTQPSGKGDGNAMQVPYSNVSTNYSLKRGALRVSLAALFLTSVVSCVTTTTGGFDPASSEEQAVIDYSRLALA